MNNNTNLSKSYDEGENKKEVAPKQKFDELVEYYNNKYKKIVEITGDWSIRNNTGVIRVCNYKNKNRDIHTVHRTIDVEYIDGDFKFYNWIEDEVDLEREIGVGIKVARSVNGDD